MRTTVLLSVARIVAWMCALIPAQEAAVVAAVVLGRLMRRWPSPRVRTMAILVLDCAGRPDLEVAR